jgi:hypothetical protein
MDQVMARELSSSEIRRLRAIRRRLDTVEARRERVIAERDALIAQLLVADAPVAGVARELRMTRQGVYNAQLRQGRADRG